VAAEVAGFDVAVPKDGDEQEQGEEEDSELHCDGESIARGEKKPTAGRSGEW